MEKQTAKMFLKRIRQEQKEIRLLMEHRAAMRFSLYGGAIRYDSDKVQISADDAFSRRLAEICDMDDVIVAHVAELDKCIAKAMSIVRCIDDPSERMILETYYLSVKRTGELYKWHDVARIVGYSEKYVLRKLHPAALRDFEKRMDCA